MNTDDRILITELADRVRCTGTTGRDPEAADLIRRAFGDLDHALYVLVQAVLVQDQTLRATQERLQEAHGRIDELQSRAAYPEQEAPGRGGFMSTLFERRDGAPAPGAPHRPAAGAPWGGPEAGRRTPPVTAAPPARPGGGGSFLNTAGGVAAGVAGGALLAQGLGSLFSEVEPPAA